MQSEPQEQSNPFDDAERILRCKLKPELLNLNQIYPTDSPSKCGYCQKENGSYSWSFTKEKIEPYTYELLMERGWRRSGNYFYKPDLQRSCCKLFTHRLQVDKYKPKKDQKKALKRVIAFAYEKIQEIKNEQKPKQGKRNNHKEKEKEMQVEKSAPKKVTNEQSLQLLKICQKITIFLKSQLPGIIKQFALTQQLFSKFTFQLSNKIKFFRAKEGQKSDFYCNYIQLIFGLNKKTLGNAKYSLFDFCRQVKDPVEGLGLVSGYQVEVQRGGYLLFKRIQKTNEFQLLEDRKEENMDIEVNDKQPKQEKGILGFFKTIKNKLTGQNEAENMPKPKLQVKKDSNKFQLLKAENQYKGEINITFNKITFGKINIEIVPAEESVQSFKLYQKYTKDIHEKKQKSMSSYVNFLCLQPLVARSQKPSAVPQQSYIPTWDPTSKHQQPKPVEGEVCKLLGSYHMKYYYEGRLIAVSVVDFVDDGLSAVYFFYDSSFKECRLGVFSSLIEIQYIKWVKLSFPEFRYYYMGFYISNCQKMNYKVDYSPCQLLCPVTYEFVDFTDQVRLMTDRVAEKKQQSLRLAPQNINKTQDMDFGKGIGPYIDKNIKILYNNKKLVLKQINPHFYVHILKIMNNNLPVWGKKIFDIWTFTL